MFHETTARTRAPMNDVKITATLRARAMRSARRAAGTPTRPCLARRVAAAAAASAAAAAAQQAPGKLRELRPAIKHKHEGRVQTENGAVTYYREYGNPSGAPVLVVHGGPGAGCFPNHARFFDPEFYRIVLADQRGCGLSRPRAQEGNLRHNNLDALVDDFETLRKHLDIDRWMLFGGSFGTTLSLAYASAHPSRVWAMVLRGVCLLRKEELDWLYRDGTHGGGAGALFPQNWLKFVSQLPPDMRDDPVAGYRNMLSGAYGQAARDAAAGAWLAWGMAVGGGLPGVDAGVLRFDKKQMQDAARDARVVPARSASTAASGEVPSYVAQATLENWYVACDGFVRDHPLLDRITDQMREEIPVIAIHGRNDFVCPVRNAYSLAEAWPESDVRVIAGAAHSMYDPAIRNELLEATDEMTKYFK